MKVFIVLRNGHIDQVFFNADPAIARGAAETHAHELTKKWAIARVVEQEVIEVGVGPVLADVSANLVYEWVRTGHWNLNKFTRWLGAKHIDPQHSAYLRRWSEDGRANWCTNTSKQSVGLGGSSLSG